MTGRIVNSSGDQHWYKYSIITRILHRLDGPAIIYLNGTKEWWVDGKRHREDGPAVVFAGGGQKWFMHGLRHREDGPAVIWPDVIFWNILFFNP